MVHKLLTDIDLMHDSSIIRQDKIFLFYAKSFYFLFSFYYTKKTFTCDLSKPLEVLIAYEFISHLP